MAERSRKKLTVAAIGDLHVRQERTGVLRELFAEMSKAADVLVLCGDLTDVGNPREAEGLAEDLRACSIPAVGVLGNHDYESGHAEEVGKILREGEPFTVGRLTVTPFDTPGHSRGPGTRCCAAIFRFARREPSARRRPRRRRAIARGCVAPCRHSGRS